MTRFLTLLAAFSLPVVALAAPSFREFVDGNLVPFIDGYIIRLLYAVAFLLFVFGIARYFFTDSDEKRQEGREFALWGILALVLLFGIWSLVRLLIQYLTTPV